MPSIQQLLIEATAVGLLLIPCTYLAGYIVKLVGKKPTLPEVCSTWNEFYIMELNLFLAGFLFHIICQVVGLNSWYCKNYIA